MGLKYYTIDPPSSASAVLRNQFQALVNDQFDVASDYYIILEEYPFASGIYASVETRVTSVIDQLTGAKLSDDWKQILFKDIDHNAELGKLYSFDNNIWLCTFSEGLKTLSANCVVRRCSDYLRWIGDDGIYYEEPCVIEYKISRSKDVLPVENPVLPQGYIDVYTQLNARTELIKGNQRFIFGRENNRVCWSVFAGGIQNTLDQETGDSTTSRLLTLTMGVNYINQQNDNLVLGVADYYKNVYAISLSPTTLVGNTGDSIQLNTNITLNGENSDKPLSYSTSASGVATVSGSGLVTFGNSGSCIITCYMTNNTTISASATAFTSASAVIYEEVRISPSPTVNILEGSTKAFTSYLYIDGVQQANTFTYSVANTNVPTDKYLFVVTGANSFAVQNMKKYLDYPLVVNATSGSYVQPVSITLKGAW